MRGYTVLPRASADLRQIWSFSLSRWGKAQADRYVRDIEARFSSIAENPNRGRAWIDDDLYLFRMSSGSHVIFYSVSAASVTIVRILHKRQDFQRHLTPPPPP